MGEASKPSGFGRLLGGKRPSASKFDDELSLTVCQCLIEAAMVLTVQELQDIGLSFSPLKFLGGGLSQQEYEIRRDKATKQQLNALLASQEYKQWMQKSLRGPSGSWKTEAGLILLGLLVVATIFSQATWVRAASTSREGCQTALQPQPLNDSC